MDVFLRFNYTSPKQECILFQPDVGVDDNDEVTTSKVQAGARKKLARLPIRRQERETASTEQSNQFDPGGQQSIHYFSVERNVCRVYCLLVFLVFVGFLLYFLCLVRKAGTRDEDNFHWIRERLGCKPDA